MAFQDLARSGFQSSNLKPGRTGKVSIGAAKRLDNDQQIDRKQINDADEEGDDDVDDDDDDDE